MPDNITPGGDSLADGDHFHRRDFLRLASYATASGAVYYSAAMTTDALGQAALMVAPGTDPETSNYHYSNN